MRASCSSAVMGTALAGAEPGPLARASSANSLVAVAVATPAKAMPTKLRLDMLVIFVFLESIANPADATFQRITHIVCRCALTETAMVRFETYFLFILGFAATPTMPLHASEVAAPTDFEIANGLFDEYRLDAHVPGLVYGIVRDGKL